MPRRRKPAALVTQYEATGLESGVISLTDLVCPLCMTISSLQLDGTTRAQGTALSISTGRPRFDQN